MRHSAPFAVLAATISAFVGIRAGGQALDPYGPPEMLAPPVDTWEPGPFYPEEMGPWDYGEDDPGFFGEYVPPYYPGPLDYWPEEYGYPPYYEPGPQDFWPEDYGYPPYYEPGPQEYWPEEEYNYAPPYEPVPQDYWPPPYDVPQDMDSGNEGQPGFSPPEPNAPLGGQYVDPYGTGISPSEIQNGEPGSQDAPGFRQEGAPQGKTDAPPAPGPRSGYRTPPSVPSIPNRRMESSPYDQFARPEVPAPQRSPRNAPAASADASPPSLSEVSPPPSLPPAIAGAPLSNLPEPLVLRRTWEESERAFNLLVPKGWETQGGLRRYSSQQSGVLQSAEAKVDYQVADGPDGAVSIRWFPRSYYFDYSRSSAGRLGVRLPGNTFDNLPAAPVKTAIEFLTQTIFPGAHPEAADVEIMEQQVLTDLARQHEQWIHPLLPEAGSDAVSLTVTYDERGVRYKERLVALIEFLGSDSGCWINSETRLYRAPLDRFEDWEPVLAVILRSFTWDAEWLRVERERLVRQNQRAGAVRPGLRLFIEAAWQRAQAAEEALSAAWINGGRDQQAYLNPFTNATENGSARWSSRWVGAEGDVIYSNRPDFDPNQDPALGRQEFKVAAAAS